MQKTFSVGVLTLSNMDRNELPKLINFDFIKKMEKLARLRSRNSNQEKKIRVKQN